MTHSSSLFYLFYMFFSLLLDLLTAFSALLHGSNSKLLTIKFSFLIGFDFLPNFLADEFFLFPGLFNLSLFFDLTILLPLDLRLQEQK